MKRSTIAFLAGALALMLSLTGMAQAQDGYRIRPGDTLRVEVLEDPTMNRSSLVAPDGRIAVPLAGAINAAGRTLEAVQADMAARLAPNFSTSPTVFVALERQKDRVAASGGAAKAPGIDVYVMGEAAKPGRLQTKPGTTVLQLFAEMGGFSKFAATKRIQLRRGDQTWLLNYPAIEAGTSKSGATTLKDGDVLVIPQRKLFE